MEVDVVIEGQQLLYTNEFDELTYNADKIVEMTSQLDEVLKRFSYSFSSKDSALIINKNLTAFLYWFVIDALYFPQSTSYEVDRINHLRKKKPSNKLASSQTFEQFDEEKFINKMRLIALKNHNCHTLQEIRQTSIDQLIEELEKQHDNITQKNEETITKFSNLVTTEKQKFYQVLRQAKINPKEGSPLLIYYNFQKQMIREWMDQVQKKKYGPQCRVCQRRDKVIKCQKCNLYVHPHCYAKLPKSYSQKQFLCQNCQKDLDDDTECIFCPMKGGYVLEVDSPQKRTTYTVTKSQGLKLKIKKRQQEKQKGFIHLSCSLWHPQVQYNIKKAKLEYIHRVDRKKTQNPCYQCGTNVGVTIPCANQNCRRYYHPECAKRIDLSTCIINAKNKLLIELYCDRHRRPYIFEILKENILNNLKQIKKLYEGIDHEIKRMLSSSYPSDRKIYIKNNNEQPQRYDCCLYCREVHQPASIPITNCWRCYNWYHKHCGNKCPLCDQNPPVPGKQ